MPSIKWKTKCKLCGKRYTNARSLGVHISRTHEIPTQKYYDKYIKKDKTEGFCEVCGKRTEFCGLNLGYNRFCSPECGSKGTVKERRDYFRETYGVDNPSQLESVQNKKENTCFIHHKVRHPSQSKKVRDKQKATWIRERGYDNPAKDPKVQKKIKKTNTELRGVPCVFQDPDVKEQIKEFWMKDSGVENAAQSERVKQIKLENNYRKYNKASPSQTDEARREASERFYKNGYKKVHPVSTKKKTIPEKYFESALNRAKIQYKSEYKISLNEFVHYFDFAVFREGKLDCLIEIDGEFYHGTHNPSIVQNCYLNRFNAIPKKVKFLRIDASKIKEGVKEFFKMYRIPYRKWLKRLRKLIPKKCPDSNIKKKVLIEDWNNLCNNSHQIRFNFGKSLLIHFCRTRLKDIWNDYRKTIYVSSVSSHNIFEGVTIFDNVPDLRNKYLIKFKDAKSIKVKKHSAEKMLAVCSLGKRYVTETLDKDSKRLAKFLKLNVKELRK